MLRILLIKPPYSRLKRSGQAPYFPLGLGYVAAVLEKEGFAVRIYHAENPRLPGESISEDEEAVFYQRSRAQKRYYEAINNDSHPVWNEVRATLNDFKPDLVGISSLTVEVPSALKISRLCKEYDSKMPVVFGGVHPTFLPEDILRHDSVDYVVRGEGEMTFLDLCQAIAKRQSDMSVIPGISFKKEVSIIHNAPRPLIEDLDTIPFPATHLILYPDSFDYKSMGSMIASRGCPWRCAFCSSKIFWEKKLRLRSPENIIAEIKEIKNRYNVNQIMFWDDSFSVSRKVVMRYCTELIKADLKVLWRTATRADLVDDEVISWMKKAGCSKLEIGVETGSPAMQQLIRKDVDNDLVRRAVKLIKSHKIPVGLFFMAGFPEEKADDMDQTFALMKELQPEEIAYNIFDPMPGSELLEVCVNLGLLQKNIDWSQFLFWPDNHFMKYMTPEEFNEKAIEIGKWVYAYNNNFFTKFRKLRSIVWFYIINDPVALTKKVGRYVERRLKTRRERIPRA